MKHSFTMPEKQRLKKSNPVFFWQPEPGLSFFIGQGQSSNNVFYCKLLDVETSNFAGAWVTDVKGTGQCLA